MNADDAQNIRRHTKEARIAGVTGLAFVVLFVTGMLLGSAVPDPSESDEEIVRFYRDGGERLLIILGAYILPFAGIAFLWFMAATRTLLLEPRHRPSAVLVPMQFAAGVLFVAATRSTAANDRASRPMSASACASLSARSRSFAAPTRS
ncbi:MAG: hypothetical protein OEM67_12030 [Thermoleophilia bacterium]|nr:hypothetical protein [Thermoleophilia bacterium]